MIPIRPGFAAAAARARSFLSPSKEGGMTMARSMPAPSISRMRSSAVNGTGLCGAARLGHGRSGVFAAQM
jgi:hypothetical protein